MPSPRVVLPPDPPGWADLRREAGVDADFPPDVLAEAERAAAAPRLPDLDLTDVAFLTVDPQGSRDLDQALALERSGDGWLLRYAIADVAAFVAPGGAVDAECLRRGETLYLPDLRVPLHPPVLSEGAASLLPDVVRPALVWTLVLGPDAEPTSVRVERALVPVAAAAVLPAGAGGARHRAHPGAAARGRAAAPGARPGARGGRAADPGAGGRGRADGRPVLTLRAPLPVEGWNAQISLLTGLAAARLMLDGGVGLLRTLPPARAAGRRGAAAQRARARAWPGPTAGPTARSSAGSTPRCRPTPPCWCSRRGCCAGRATAPSTGRRPSSRCTAPCCAVRALHGAAAAAGRPARGGGLPGALGGLEVPGWARDALPLLPDVMAGADRRAARAGPGGRRPRRDLLLAPRVGELFDGAVVEASPEGRRRAAARPGRCGAGSREPSCPLGRALRVELVTADPVTRTVRFRPSG